MNMNIKLISLFALIAVILSACGSGTVPTIPAPDNSAVTATPGTNAAVTATVTGNCSGALYNGAVLAHSYGTAPKTETKLLNDGKNHELVYKCDENAQIVVISDTVVEVDEDKVCFAEYNGNTFVLEPNEYLELEGKRLFHNVNGECVPVNEPAATLASVLPTAQAMQGGFTDCNAFEAAVMARMPGVPRDQVGTKEHPIDYRGFSFHDFCFAWAGNGTGLKYVILDGPAVAQIGEGCNPAGVLYLKAEDKTYTGCVNGGWAYESNAAVEAQWKLQDGKVVLESASQPYRYGQACGYKRDLKLEDVKGYRWDGSKLVVTPDLECPYTLAQLLANDFGGDSTNSSYGDQPYIQFKVEYQGTWYCGFRPSDVKFPKGTRVIEDWTQYPKPDLGFARDSGEWGMTLDQGFCKGHPVDANNNPVAQKAFVTVYLTSEGIVPVTFPLK